MDEDVTPWTELREFTAVDLTASWVLSWQFEGGALRLDVDLGLMPAHPFYEAPRPSEPACVRPAVLEFPGCTAVDAGAGRGRSPDAVAGRLGVGRIHDLQRTGEGVYRLEGRFGRVVIHADRPLLHLQKLAD